MATLVGVDRRTGQAISGIDHLHQSIEDLITTRVGSRVIRPEYGSHLPAMVDMGISPGLASAYQAEVSRAIQRWDAAVRGQGANRPAMIGPLRGCPAHARPHAPAQRLRPTSVPARRA